MVKEIVSFKGISYFVDTDYYFSRWFKCTDNSIFYIDVGGVNHLLFLSRFSISVYDLFKELEDFYRFSDLKRFTFPDSRYFTSGYYLYKE